MAQNKINKILISIIILLCLVISGFSAYPQFVFSQNNFQSGQVNLSLQASSGVKVALYINGNYVGQQDMIANQKDVYLTSDILDQTIAVGQNLHFVNNDSSRVYKLNFSSGTYQSLSYLDSMNFKSYNLGTITYIDESTGIGQNINVNDILVNNSFTNINQNYLVDGQNTVGFIYYSILNGSKLGEKNQTVNYDKYPNKILASSANITNINEVKVTGSVTSSTSPFFFILNNNGVIGNLGQLKQITLNGSTFNATISNLAEGNNSIRFISVDPTNNQVFNGEKIIYVFVDTLPPQITIDSASYTGQINGNSEQLSADLSNEVFINGNSLKLNITTDALNITSELNGKNNTYSVVNDSVSFDLSLVKGKNNLTLYAIDIAGNIAKEAHSIYFDNDAIGLKNVTPKQGDTVHFFIQDFSGYVSKGDVEITAFSIPKGAKVWDPSTNTDKSVSCSDYAFMGIRDLGQIKSSAVTEPQYNTDDFQVSLTSIISDKVTTTSDSDGKFKVENIILQEDSFTSSDASSANSSNPKVGNVKSSNIVCFVMSDKYGNTITKDITITLDNGNTLWKPGEITTMPNTIYAAEVEQTGDARSGNGKVRFGVIARIQYIGDGTLTNINGVTVTNDASINTESKNAKIVTSEMNYKVDPNTNEMIVYFPVEVSPMNIKPLEYPSELKFYFKMHLTYNVNDKSIPIDTTNPVYFWTTVNVEKPLDHAKWLTPAMIDKSLSFLNKTISFTKQATSIMGTASVVGVLTCTGAKFWHGYKIAAIMVDSSLDETEKQKAKMEADRNLYMICDRIACTNAPAKADTLTVGGKDSEMVNIDSKSATSNGKTSVISNNNIAYTNSKTGLQAGELKNYQSSGYCDYTDENGNIVPGAKISADLIKYEQEVSSLTGAVVDTKGTSKVSNFCTQANYIFTCNSNETNMEAYLKLSPEAKKQCTAKTLQSFNAKTVGSATFNPGFPKFDDTRCNFFWLDDNDGTVDSNWKESGVAGRSSSGSIFSSIRCGCITDTYSHLKNWLKVQEGIQMCLLQAKVGTVKGSYCERLMSQAVCDIATNIVLPEVERSIQAGSPGTDDDDRNPTANFLSQMRATDKEMNQRYSGTFLSQAGLSTDQIVNKACVGAITGDWSVLTDNILTAIDKNEVEPVFGPPFAESRLQGYNPITGTLSIRYIFTYGAISGGQSIQTTVELVCDKGESNGEFCPDDGLISSSQVTNGEFKTKTLSVSKGSSAQDTVILSEEKARFWYNKIRLTHKYTIKKEVKTRTEEFTIVHKSEVLLANCYFTAGLMGSGAGIFCDSMFGEDALVSSFSIDKTKTKIVPSTVLYPENNLYLDLAYSSSNSQSVSESISLGYMAICGSGNNKVYLGKSSSEPATAPYKLELDSDTPSSLSKVLKLYTIPQFTTSNSAASLVYVTTTEVPFTSGTKYAIEFSNPSGLGADLPINKIYLKDSKDAVIQNIAIPQYITQKFNVNQANAKAQAQYMDISSIDTKGNIVIEFSSPISGVVINIVEYTDNSGKYTSGSIVSRFGISNTVLSAGSCKLKLRIMPTSQIDQLTNANFDTYSSVSSNFTNVKTNDIIEIPFTLQTTPTSNADTIEKFDVVGLHDGSYICLNMVGNEVSDSQTLPLQYIYQNAANGNPSSGVELSYTLSTNAYGTLSSATIKDLGTCDSRDISFDLSDKSGLKSLLANASEQSSASSWAFGSTSAVAGTLSYTVTSTKSISGSSKTTTLNKKDYKVYFVASDSCPTTQTVLTCASTQSSAATTASQSLTNSLSQCSSNLVQSTCTLTDDTQISCYCDKTNSNQCYDNCNLVKGVKIEKLKSITTEKTQGGDLN